MRRIAGSAIRAVNRRSEIRAAHARKRKAEQKYPTVPSAVHPIVLDVYVSQNLMHLAPLYRALKRRAVVPVYVALRDATDATREAAVRRGIHEADILMGDALFRARPSVTVACDQAWEWIHPPVAGVPRIQTFHGCLLKSYSDAMRDLAKFDHFFFPGPLYKATFEAHVMPHVNRSVSLHDTGMPRTDDILDLRSRRERAYRALGLDPAVKTVLYAPTWHLEATFVSHGLEIVQAVSKMGHQCIVRPHPYALDPSIGVARRRAGNVLKACGELPGAVLGHDKDDRDVMAASDVMIADFGSIAYEYLILDRPVVFFDSPAYHALLRDDDLESWGRVAGPIVREAAGLQKAITAAVESPEEYSDRRGEVLSKIYFNLGRASEACSEAIERIALGHSAGSSAGQA